MYTWSYNEYHSLAYRSVNMTLKSLNQVIINTIIIVTSSSWWT